MNNFDARWLRTAGTALIVLANMCLTGTGFATPPNGPLRIRCNTENVWRGHVAIGDCDPAVDPPQPPNDLNCELLMEPGASDEDILDVIFNWGDPLGQMDGELPCVLFTSNYVKWQGALPVRFKEIYGPGSACSYDVVDDGGTWCEDTNVSRAWLCCEPSHVATGIQNLQVIVEWFIDYNSTGTGFLVHTEPVIPDYFVDAFLDFVFIPQSASGYFEWDRTVYGLVTYSNYWYRRETYREVRTFSINYIDLDIDSDNNNGFDPPDRTPVEDSWEDDATRPGKLIMVNNVDDDDDEVPGFADSLEEKWQGSGGSQAWFVPVVLQFSEPSVGNSQVLINFTYAASNPAGVSREPGPGDELGTQYQADPEGRLRLWTKDGNERRSVVTIPNGDYVSPGWHSLSDFGNSLQQDGTIKLYLEAVRPSPAQGADSITASIQIFDDTGTLIYSSSDSIRVTAVDVELHDLRAWGPVMNADGSAGITNLNLDADIPDSQVGGAITDGASICLLRMTPRLNLEHAGISTATIQVAKADGSRPHPQVTGTLKSVPVQDPSNPTPLQLPLLPEPFPPSETGGTADFSSGKAFYIPPESYVDPAYNEGSPESLNHDEICRMTFNVICEGCNESINLLGSVPFLLRRPPLVLVHGIMSDFGTWEVVLYNETPESPFATRIYKADWSTQSTQGYSESFNRVASKIDDALRDYRSATDGTHARGFNGIRYAATRADVVAHSQGGQLTRLYISNLNGAAARGGAWPALTYWRNGANGALAYLNASNFGAGSIRRFVTLGSPFKGSPIANQAAEWLEPTPSNVALLVAARPLLSEGLDHLLFNPNGLYIPPTCVADLSVGSVAQSLLETAVYPAGHKSIRWFPLVGIATISPGSTASNASFIFDLMYGGFIPAVAFAATGGIVQIIPPPPGQSDLIVPHCSQRNQPSGCGTPSDPILPGEIFEFTSHSAFYGILVGETNSAPMRDKAANLLYALPSAFNTSWSIGP